MLKKKQQPLPISFKPRSFKLVGINEVVGINNMNDFNKMISTKEMIKKGHLV